MAEGLPRSTGGLRGGADVAVELEEMRRVLREPGAAPRPPGGAGAGAGAGAGGAPGGLFAGVSGASAGAVAAAAGAAAGATAGAVVAGPLGAAAGAKSGAALVAGGAALGSAAGAVAQAYGRRIESYLPVQPLAAAAEWVQLPSPAQILPGGWAREDSRKEK